ncbi:MAG: type IX secretion system sortase PorU, partial [Bacteroidales bacterium]|nr:type IX secretion system sortase PorU [Bacteroidales bacterium]
EESLIIVYSIASDDYYGFLDGPGDNLLDIGIGRFPVQTVEQATIAVDKIIHYATNSEIVMKDWRNVLCFVADDEDGNLHLRQAEEMADYVDTNYGVYNIDKIYVDAFPQASTPGGQRSPEVNLAINNRIDKGCLIMNYTGHGGEVGWGHERFLENSDINSWTNYDHMPIFITATCEFSRYDDPERTSAGEYAYLNPQGGAIAMFTTARATFGGSNFNLNTALFDYMFEENNGEYYRFGDLIRLAKNNGGVDGNDKKFILLGDPALHLAYPKSDIITTRINDEDVSMQPDTLQALKKITIEGEVINSTWNGNIPFNGTVYPIVFDKPSQITTLGSDPTSYQNMFEIQNNILYKGKAQVTDGKFSFTFIVPKDIAYQYGFGKISYYAANDELDAHGFYDNIMVGGLDQSVEPDNAGPRIELFMNNPYFVFGGITDENPDMLAYVSDASGINTVGTGIGHDIVATLDGNTEKPIILNEFYESDLDSYTSGTIRYPIYGLEEGLHTLSLKVWDVFNNSTEASIEFTVVSSERFMISELGNYPNPFNDKTSFIFSHNQAEGELDVKLNIYNLNGQIVKTFETSIIPTGYRSQPIDWDGSADSGVPLAKGMYIYRVIVRNEQGQTDDLAGKLILIK